MSATITDIPTKTIPASLTAPRTLADTVQTLLDIEVTAKDTEFTDLAGFALRDNPRRAHLIVSRVLGKHIPVAPSLVLKTGHQLGHAVYTTLASEGISLDGALVVGYCETATGLGHAVAEHLHANYLHTTRKAHPTLDVEAGFDEEHSHAVGHLIQPRPGISLSGTGPLILVDDELTTGKTALNTIEALQEQFPRSVYIIATLLDARTPSGREAFAARAATMGVDVHVVSVLSAYLTLPENVLEQAQAVLPRLVAPAATPTRNQPEVIHHEATWPANLDTTARHGMTMDQTLDLITNAHVIGHRIAAAVNHDSRILVLGTEELLHLPVKAAEEIEWLLPNATVRFQSTTRSPVHPSNDPGYAIRRTVTFEAPDEPGRVSRVHNLIDPADPHPNWEHLAYDDIVIVVDADYEACADMVRALSPYARQAIHVVTVPSTTDLS